MATTTQPVAGGNVAAPPRGVAAYTTPLPASTRKQSVVERHMQPFLWIGAAFFFLASFTLSIVLFNIAPSLSSVHVLTENTTTYRAISTYSGQGSEMTRYILDGLVAATLLAFVLCMVPLCQMHAYASEGAIIILPVVFGLILLVTGLTAAVQTAPGATDNGAVERAASNWLELDHNIPYDVSDFMGSRDAPDGSFSKQVSVTDEFNTKHTLTIARGGAHQQVYTLRLNAK